MRLEYISLQMPCLERCLPTYLIWTCYTNYKCVSFQTEIIGKMNSVFKKCIHSLLTSALTRCMPTVSVACSTTAKRHSHRFGNSDIFEDGHCPPRILITGNTCSLDNPPVVELQKYMYNCDTFVRPLV